MTNEPAKPGQADRTADVAEPVERQAERDDSQRGSRMHPGDGTPPAVGTENDEALHRQTNG